MSGPVSPVAGAFSQVGECSAAMASSPGAIVHGAGVADVPADPG
jgi:hypothetical protein